MAKTATFEIVINGIKESISAVDSLNKSLDALEQRIDALAKKNVNVSAKVSGSNTKELKQEEALLKKIDQLHQKVADTEKKEYQELLHAKEELKEYQTIAKAIAAEQNISSGVNNPNTMLGMKAQLHDIKAAMQIVDVDSDKFKQMQKQANDLNNKLKELESGYGQYGRNVGNYANGVAEGMQKVRVQVGDTVREFNSARDASRTLNNELKAMALNGQQDTQAYKDLDAAVKQVNSTIEDTKRSSVMMDNLLDTMQGMTALASIGVGISNLFGIDDADFNKTMQQFASLTLVMDGIEKLQLQLTKKEGIFSGFFGKIADGAKKMMKSFTDSIDDAGIKLEEFILKRTKANKELEQNGFQLKGFNKKEQELLSDIINLLKEKLYNDKTKDSYNTYIYLYHFIQSMDSNPELKYILAYMSKSLGFTDPMEFNYNKDKQFVFESILFSAMTLYSNGGASKNKLGDSHKRFIENIEAKKEEKLSRTQELNTVKIQALKELGYTGINEDNAKEIFEKIF